MSKKPQIGLQSKIGEFFSQSHVQNGGKTQEKAELVVVDNPRKRTRVGTSDTDDINETEGDDVYEDSMSEVEDDEKVTRSWIMATLHKSLRTITNEISASIDKVVADVIQPTKDKVDKLENENIELKSAISKLTEKIESLEQQHLILFSECNHNSQYSRKNTIRVLGIPEKNVKYEKDRKNEDCKLSVCENETIVECLSQDILHPDKVEVAHRIGAYDPKSKYPRPIIMKMKFRQFKDNIMKEKRALKGSKIIIYEDLSHGNRRLLYNLKQHPQVTQGWSSNGKILAQLRNGEVIHVDVCDDIDDAVKSGMTRVTTRRRADNSRGDNTSRKTINRADDVSDEAATTSK